MKATILVGDVLERLRELPDESVQCVVTSPPYWGLRDYSCEGQLGLERTPEEYIAKMVAVFREVRRVLRDDGTLWLNIGDSYSRSPEKGGSGTPNGRNGYGDGYADAQRLRSESNGSSDGAIGRGDRAAVRNGSAGLKPKDLVGIPWMLAFALRADGWYLRQDIIWSKPNPMPESVRDRCTKAHEYIFLLSKSTRYFYNGDAIKEPLAATSIARLSQDVAHQLGSDRVPGKTNGRMKAVRFGVGKYGDSDTEETRTKSGNEWEPSTDKRNKRSVWTIGTQPYTEAHFATYPEALVEPCILAGSREGDTVLDPFGGSGTTGAVALRYHRDAILIELNPEYANLAQKRIGAEAPMFNEVEVVPVSASYSPASPAAAD